MDFVGLVCAGFMVSIVCLAFVNHYVRRAKLDTWYQVLGRPKTERELMDGFERLRFTGTCPFKTDEILEYGKHK